MGVGCEGTHGAFMPGPALTDKNSPARNPGPELSALLVFQEKPAILMFKLISKKKKFFFLEIGHQVAFFKMLLRPQEGCSCSHCAPACQVVASDVGQWTLRVSGLQWTGGRATLGMGALWVPPLLGCLQRGCAVATKPRGPGPLAGHALPLGTHMGP